MTPDRQKEVEAAEVAPAALAANAAAEQVMQQAEQCTKHVTETYTHLLTGVTEAAYTLMEARNALDAWIARLKRAGDRLREQQRLVKGIVNQTGEGVGETQGQQSAQ